MGGSRYQTALEQILRINVDSRNKRNSVQGWMCTVEIVNEIRAAFYKINKSEFMVAIFGAPPLLPSISGVYFRLKQFILDIYNGRWAYNADQLSATKIIKIRNVTFRRIYCFNNGK